VEYLHKNNIVHRDLKPENVLLVKQEENIVPKIADLGLSRRVKNSDEFSKSEQNRGTMGWMAPEMLNPSTNVKPGKPVDMFVLGILLYFIFTTAHPFGEIDERQSNIRKARFNLKELPKCHFFVMKVIEALLSEDPAQRPTIQDIKCSPILWIPKEEISFLSKVSDAIENMKNRHNQWALHATLEKHAYEVITGEVQKNNFDLDDTRSPNWWYKIERPLRAELKSKRNYNGETLRDLLRAIRNCYHHHLEMENPYWGTAVYWIQRFPKLLYFTYDVYKCFSGETSATDLLKLFKQKIKNSQAQFIFCITEF